LLRDESLRDESLRDESLHDEPEPLRATALRPPSGSIIDGGEIPCTNFFVETKNIHMSSISPSSGSLATIIRSFKSAVTIRARFVDPKFEWQPRFYDHIILTKADLKRIRDYIRDNPGKWNNG